VIITGVPNFELERIKRETFPVRLFELGGNPIKRFTDIDYPVRFVGQTYEPKGITYSKIENKRSMEVDSCKVAVDNIDDAMIAWAMAVDPTGYYTRVLKGFTDAVDAGGYFELIAGTAVVLFHGRNTSAKVDDEFELTVKAATDFYRQIGPRSTQDVTCRFRGINGFKGTNCGYAGSETVCNYTEARCRELGNFARFGGFPSLNTKVDS
jgi:phage-related protein